MYLRASSAAKLIDLPMSTFYQLVREGKLPPAVSKLGKHRLWSREQLVATVDPKGYKASHDNPDTAPRNTPAAKTQRKGPLLLAPRSGDASSRATGKAAGRSPFFGILGGAGDGAGHTRSGDGITEDRGDG